MNRVEPVVSTPPSSSDPSSPHHAIIQLGSIIQLCSDVQLCSRAGHHRSSSTIPGLPSSTRHLHPWLEVFNDVLPLLVPYILARVLNNSDRRSGGGVRSAVCCWCGGTFADGVVVRSASGNRAGDPGMGWADDERLQLAVLQVGNCLSLLD
jgi:hypothetical protein